MLQSGRWQVAGFSLPSDTLALISEASPPSDCLVAMGSAADSLAEHAHGMPADYRTGLQLAEQSRFDLTLLSGIIRLVAAADHPDYPL